MKWPWDPIPWRRVTATRPYEGPRGGKRVHLTLCCGHTTDRSLSKAEREGEPINQLTSLCYPCWWKAGNGYRNFYNKDLTHFSLITGGRRAL